MRRHRASACISPCSYLLLANPLSLEFRLDRTFGFAATQLDPLFGVSTTACFLPDHQFGEHSLFLGPDLPSSHMVHLALTSFAQCDEWDVIQAGKNPRAIIAMVNLCSRLIATNALPGSVLQHSLFDIMPKLGLHVSIMLLGIKHHQECVSIPLFPSSPPLHFCPNTSYLVLNARIAFPMGDKIGLIRLRIGRKRF